MLDPDRLERNPYPFKIYPARLMRDEKKENTHHNGFILTMRAEYRDIMGGTREAVDLEGSKKMKVIKPFEFKCWVKGPRTLWVKAPLLSWSDRGNDDEVIRTEYGDDHLMMVALDEHRNDFIERNDKNSSSAETAHKIFVLDFPPKYNVALDGDVLYINRKAKKKEAGLLKLNAVNIAVDVMSDEDLASASLFNVVDEITNVEKAYIKWKMDVVPRLVWHVADLSEKTKQVGRKKEDVESSDSEAEGVAAMRKKAANMKIG